MEKKPNDPREAGLPYFNNFWIILGTALFNVLCVLAFHWGKELSAASVIVSAVYCGIISSFICVVIVHRLVQRMRRAGALPRLAPESRLMMRLPKNPALLALCFAILFGALAAGFNVLAIRFFEIATFRLARFAVWQAAYSCVLSAMAVELAVLRFVQPDCAEPGQPEQTGSAKVLDPLPKFSSLASWFNTVTDDFGFNMVVGLVSGGTLVVDHNVIITPTTLSGIVISSLALGVIVTLRMARPIAKSMYDARESGSLPPLEKRNGFLSALPYKPMGMTLALMLPIMLLSLLVFWSVLTFFDFQVLNFFQFFVIRTLYVALLTKLVVAVLVARYRQPSQK